MTREQALDYIHDPRPAPLTPEELRGFEAWLEGDAELRALHSRQTALFAALDDWADDVEPSANFDQRLFARIEAESARPTWTQTLTAWLSWPRAAWAGCAVATLAAVAVWIGPQQQPVEPPSVTKVALSGEDAEFLRDINRALDDIEMLIEFDALAPDRI